MATIHGNIANDVGKDGTMMLRFGPSRFGDLKKNEIWPEPISFCSTMSPWLLARLFVAFMRRFSTPRCSILASTSFRGLFVWLDGQTFVAFMRRVVCTCGAFVFLCAFMRSLWCSCSIIENTSRSNDHVRRMMKKEK